MSSRGLDDLYVAVRKPRREIPNRSQAILQVILVQHLVQTNRQGLQISPGEAAVGWEALGEDQQIPCLFRHRIIVQRKEAADIPETVLLEAHRCPIGITENLFCNFTRSLVGKSCLAFLDEVSILSKSASINDKRNPVLAVECRNRADIRH